MEKQSIQEALQGLQKAIIANQNYKVDYFDLKYLNDTEAEIRAEVKQEIQRYRAWLEMAASQRDIKVVLLTNFRGMSMKDNLMQTITTYRKVKAIRIFLTKLYWQQHKIK